MHLKRFGGLLLTCVLTTVLFADWSEWSPMVPDQPQNGREHLIVIRVAAGDNASSARGTPFQYELHNTSRDQSARIVMSLPELDPATGSWRQPAKPLEFVLRPNGRHSGSTFSPESGRLLYGGKIIWDDAPGNGDSEPDNENEEPEPPAPPPGRQTNPDTITQFETDQWGSVVIPRHLLQDHTTLVDIEFIAEESDKEGAAFVAEFINNYGANKFDAPDAYGRVISINGSRVHGFFHGINLARSFGGAANNIMTVVQLIKITRLSGNKAGEDEEEPALRPGVPNSSPSRSSDKKTTTEELRPGKIDAAPTQRKHSGYWFDPSDKDADETAFNPVIYVRYLGQAKRILLSEAQSIYGVPKDAKVDNMTHYNERTKVIKYRERGTHLPPQDGR